MAAQPDLFSSSTGAAAPSASLPRLIPFGKYRNQPFETLLTDSDYAIWLLNSMKAKLEHQYPALLAFLLGRYGVPDCTPEHNKLQNRFLDRTFALQFALAASERIRDIPRMLSQFDLQASWTCFVEGALQKEKTFREAMSTRDVKAELDRVRDKLEQVAKALQFYANTGTLLDSKWMTPVTLRNLEFEQDGADVSYIADCGCDMGTTVNILGDTHLYGYRGVDAFRVEVKPIIGDDYPAILRAMKAVKTKQLLVGEYCGAGATWEEVVKVFALSGITVVRLEDVERTVVPDTFDGIEFTPLAMGVAEAVVERVYRQFTEAPKEDAVRK